jgi:membrane-bound metal-dependent hydrolase YbcI (DUF457 family)
MWKEGLIVYQIVSCSAVLFVSLLMLTTLLKYKSFAASKVYCASVMYVLSEIGDHRGIVHMFWIILCSCLCSFIFCKWRCSENVLWFFLSQQVNDIEIAYWSHVAAEYILFVYVWEQCLPEVLRVCDAFSGQPCRRTVLFHIWSFWFPSYVENRIL